MGLADSVYTYSWLDEGLKTLSNANARPWNKRGALAVSSGDYQKKTFLLLGLKRNHINSLFCTSKKFLPRFIILDFYTRLDKNFWNLLNQGWIWIDIVI